MEMRYLRSMCGARVKDRLENEEIRKRVGMQSKMLDRMERFGLRWFGYVERMGEKSMVKRIYLEVLYRISKNNFGLTYSICSSFCSETLKINIENENVK